MKTAVKDADSFKKPIAVIGADADLLILLLHLVKKEGPGIYMFSDIFLTNSKIFFINEIKFQLGERFCDYYSCMLFCAVIQLQEYIQLKKV